MLLYASDKTREPMRIDSDRTIVISLGAYGCQLTELENGQITGIVSGKPTDEAIERMWKNGRHFLLPHTPHPFRPETTKACEDNVPSADVASACEGPVTPVHFYLRDLCELVGKLTSIRCREDESVDVSDFACTTLEKLIRQIRRADVQDAPSRTTSSTR